MYISICLVFMMLTGNAASAAETNAVPMDTLWCAHFAITALGALMAAWCAYQVFGKRVELADVPTFPKYMTSKQQYRLGSVVYVLFAGSFFLLLVYLYKEVVSVVQVFEIPVFGTIVDAFLSPTIINAVNSYSAPYLLIIAVIGMIYLYLLQREAQWNVLLMMRDLIHGWISIPALAHDVVGEIQGGLRVPGDTIAEVIRAGLSVNPQDFSKGRNTIDRKWAEICYMQWWLGARQESGNDATFFVEESFGFDKLLGEFESAGEEIKLLAKAEKAGEGIEKPDTARLADRITGLHKKFSRLVACYLIYRIEDRTLLMEEARKFGIALKNPPLDNPLVYSIVYIVTLVACVYVGVYLSAVLFDWAYNGNPLLTAIRGQDGAKIHEWIIYSAGNYGLTIILILSLRMGARAVGIGTESPVTYCWTFLIALLTGPFVLAVLAKYVQPIEPYASMEPLALFYQMLVWGLGPALICVYITYYLNRETSPDRPKNDRSLSAAGWRLLNSFCFGAGTVLLLLPSLLTIPETSAVLWPVEKLRFVSTGTTFLLSAGLALAAQFALRKRAKSSRDTGAAGTAAEIVG